MDASIIIPVLNEGPRLRACLEAVLAQRFEGDVEVLVVDGGSDDGGIEAVQDLPVRFFSAPGSGAGEARNLGAKHARSEFYVFTDADCVPQAGWLTALATWLDDRPGFAGCGGGLRNGTRGRPGTYEDWDTRAAYRGVITSNAAYRAGPFREVGGFDPELRCAEDWDLAWRLLEADHRVGFCGEAVVEHDPVESLDYPSFLRKQVWYARNDVPSFRRNGFGPQDGTGLGRASARAFCRTAALHATGTALLASLVLAPAGFALLGASAVLTAAGVRRAARSEASFAGLVVHNFVKSFTRGAGTWLGLLDQLRGTAPGARLHSLAPLPGAMELEAVPVSKPRDLRLRAVASVGPEMTLTAEERELLR